MYLVPDIRKLGNVCWAHDLLYIVKPISQVTQIIGDTWDLNKSLSEAEVCSAH